MAASSSKVIEMAQNTSGSEPSKFVDHAAVVEGTQSGQRLHERHVHVDVVTHEGVGIDGIERS